METMKNLLKSYFLIRRNEKHHVCEKKLLRKKDIIIAKHGTYSILNIIILL